MDVSRRMAAHVQVVAAAMLFLLLWKVAAVASVSIMQSFSNTNGQDDCMARFPRAALDDLLTDGSSQQNIFEHLLPNILIERVPGTAGNTLVREFIQHELRKLGWLVEEDTFRSLTPFGGVTFSNIIATLYPAATKRVVIACHYDSKYMPGRLRFLGASDSAVPCSIMMDTARYLSGLTMSGLDMQARDVTPQLIFFDGEEAFVQWTASDSLYGSRHLASLWEATPDANDPSAPNNLANINFFILMDLIGPSDTQFVNYYTNTSLYFHQLVSIEQCLQANNLMTRRHPRTIFNPHGRAQFVEDDHVPFVRRGVPVLHLISTPFPRVWHTVYDNLQHLDVGLIRDFSRIFRIFLLSVL
ncbi:unnamed protein product [Candidula unifasciata]|uniref:Glutaminyl-peptide cyclotransferase n=1 Tax=Candidula unifasciata TaxID=100452 RepID=A0A8S4A839_9EUPU|nr:unnamed protein product [Candidula unifasciata]